MATKRVSILGTVSVIVGIIVGLLGIYTAVDKLFFSYSKLEVVSAQVSGSTIDLRLQNSGRTGAHVFRASFIITAHTFSEFVPSLREPSASYMVAFPLQLEPNPAPVDVPLSHDIAAGDADRIMLTLGLPPLANGQRRGMHTYSTKIVLSYDNPQRQVASEPLTISLLSGSGTPKSTADILKGLKGGKAATIGGEIGN